MIRAICFQFTLLAASAFPAPASGSDYAVLARYQVGGTGTYDYIRFDPATRRLFASHQTRVEVLDADTGRLLGSITGLRGVHGIALARDLGRGFVSNGADGTVTVFDLTTLKITQTIQTSGNKPDAIEYDPANKRVVVSNGHSNNESIIDAVTGKVLHTAALAGNPESIVFDGRGHVLVDLESHNSIAQIDVATGEVLADWPLAPGEGPTGLAIDRINRRVFVSCGGNETMVVLDADSGKKIASLPIGDDSDGAGFDPATLRAYSSNRDGTLTVIAEETPDRFSVFANVATQLGARTMTVDSAKNRVYRPVVKFGPTPAATPANPEPTGPVLPDTFEILVVGQPSQ